MTEETKANIGYAGVVAFIAAFVFASWIVSDYGEAHKAIEQYDATTFDTPPSEAINPEGGAVSFDWDGMHWVVAESTWEARTSS